MHPNFSGLWNANLSKSRVLGTPPKSVFFKIEHSHTDLAVEMMITDAESGVHPVLFRGPMTGAEAHNDVLGQQWRSCLRWIGEELLIESWVTAGERQFHFRDFWSLAKDGQTLTMEHRDDDLKGQITFLERAPHAGQQA